MVYGKLFLSEENLFAIYGQQRVRTSYFSEKKYPSTTIGNFRHESKRSARNFFLTEENLLTIYGHLHIVWRGVFGKN